MKFESVRLDDKRYLIPHHEIVRLAKPPAAICGVYFLVRNGAVVYVGQSKNVAYRILQHQKKKEFDRVLVVECAAEMLACVEETYIADLKPELNVQLRPFSTRGRNAHRAVVDYWKALDDEDDARHQEFLRLEREARNQRKANAIAQGREHSERPAGAEG